ncbi:hypothetical protein BDV95DRAFT_142258 [Massariosphaeria phaeospora]|uniref:Uncharacterized protein n=1 Tax=Massariosphaeria phaeospora TaxID=100035 RepID=A0A7C8MCX0_9PLEO|nr:hypothetical protein BDV95DRAFT_142258 [Massariosphaeria phaeospora]
MVTMVRDEMRCNAMRYSKIGKWPPCLVFIKHFGRLGDKLFPTFYPQWADIGENLGVNAKREWVDGAGQVGWCSPLLGYVAEMGTRSRLDIATHDSRLTSSFLCRWFRTSATVGYERLKVLATTTVDETCTSGLCFGSGARGEEGWACRHLDSIVDVVRSFHFSNRSISNLLSRNS